jgi:hypothetical protein
VNWFLNLLSGWLPLGVNSEGKGKSFGEWAGKLIWVVGIVLGLMFIDKVFNKPPQTTIAAGGTQIIQQVEQRDLAGFGCNMWRGFIKVGISSK